VEETGNAGMVEANPATSFIQERIHVFGAANSLGVRHLDRDIVHEHVIIAAIDRAEPPSPQLFANRVSIDVKDAGRRGIVNHILPPGTPSRWNVRGERLQDLGAKIAMVNVQLNRFRVGRVQITRDETLQFRT
jgi:hypothetical protein